MSALKRKKEGRKGEKRRKKKRKQEGKKERKKFQRTEHILQRMGYPKRPANT